MRKITIVQNSLKTVYVFRLNNIKTYMNSGYNVHVIAPNDCSFSYEELTKLGVKISFMPTMKNKFLNMFISLVMFNFHILNSRIFNNSIYIVHFVSTLFYVFPSLLFFNKKLFIYIEGLGSLCSKSGGVGQKILTKLLKINYGLNLFCNATDKKIVGRDNDVVTGGIGINLSNFKFKEKNQNNNEFKLLFVGRLIDDKGVFDAIELLRSLLNDNFNCSLTLVGDIYPNNPSSLDYSKIELLKSEFKGNIEFLGYERNVYERYCNCDLLLLPSIREGFPVCVMEASSTGTLTLAYDVPGSQDAISDGVNGYLVPLKDKDKLVKKVKEIYYDNLHVKLSNNCNLYAQSFFDSQAKSDELVNIINKL